MRCIIICCVYIHCTSTCMNIIIHMSVCHSDTFDIHMTYVFLEKFFSAIAGWSYGTSVQAQIKWWNCVIASRSIWAPSTYLMYQNISKEHPYHLKSLFLFFTEIYHRAFLPVIRGFSGTWALWEASSILRGPIFHFCPCWRNKPMEHPIFQSFSFENGGFSIPCWICRRLICLSVNGFCKGETNGQ